MSDNRFQRYLYQKNKYANKPIQLQLSDSQDDKKDQTKKTNLKQLKIDDLFNNRIKNKEQASNNNKSIEQKDFNSFGISTNQHKWQRQDKYQFSDLPKQHQQLQQKNQQKKPISSKIQKQIKTSKQVEIPIYQPVKVTIKHPYAIARQKQLQQQRKQKRQEKKQQQKRKQQQALNRKRSTFKSFLNNITQKKAGQLLNAQKKVEQGQLHNISMFNKMQEQNIQKMSQRRQTNLKANNTGLVYKKLTMEREKIPLSFLKLLLSYKFSKQKVTQQTKRVPNSFDDQMTYKKTFHYLVVNQCVADIQQRLHKISEGSTNSFQINISNFKNNSDGFVQFNISQQLYESKKPVQKGKQKEKCAIKNLSLSKNRLGLITNVRNVKIQHYGTPSAKDEKIFAFICMLVTPQSKQQLNAETKALCSIPIDNLDIILKLNKTTKCRYYDLQKISTHLRQYQAISHLYQTDLSSFVYKPQLIQKHQLDMIPEEERLLLDPILQKLRTLYNTTQYESIRQMVLRQSGIVLLQGPPGTGKTTTLMGLLAAEYQYLKNICGADDQRKIMICAPSNAAIDHITKRLVCQGLVTTQSANFSVDGSFQQQNTTIIRPNVLRIGIVETDDPDILSVSLDNICDKQLLLSKKNLQKRNSMTGVQIKQKMIHICKQINHLRLRKNIQDWQRQSKISNLNFQYHKYNNLLYNFHKQKFQLKQTYNQIQNKLFQEADIILTTLSSSGSQKMQKLRGFIGCLIVDQAAQSTEPSILIPLQTGVTKVLLIGDPYQLPSTTMSQDSSVTLFNRSLFQRFIDNGVKPYFLNVQYRMAPMIRQFPSKSFYNNRLTDAQSVLQRYEPFRSKQQNGKTNQNYLKPISQFIDRNSIFIDIKFGEQQFSSDSYKNIGECLVIKSLILNFIKKTDLSIGVITPYQGQRKMLIKQLKKQLSSESQLTNQIEKYKKTHKQQIENQQKQFNTQNLQNLHMIEQGQIEGQKPQKIQKIQKQIENCNKKQQKMPQNAQFQNQTPPYRPPQKQIPQNAQFQNQTPPYRPPQKQKTPQQLLQQRVMINTVDSFQGQQKDIIIVSTVRSNNRKDIGFMKDQRRINVALTRSRHLLIVVGNGDTIGSNQIWNRYLEWSQQHKCYYQINQRESVKRVLVQINKGFNDKKITRIRHKKLSKDIRKQQRSQIKRQDFGLQSRKRVKLDKQAYNNNNNNNEHKSKQNKNRMRSQSQEQRQKKYKAQISTNEKQKQKKVQKQDKQQRQILNEKQTEQLLQLKRARQEQAKRFQQANRRVRELQQKLKSDQNNPYAKLFD